MFCRNCGNQLNEGSNFCPRCGMQISIEQVSSVNTNNEQVVSQVNSQVIAPETEVKENVVMGSIGAFIGACVGGLSIFFFGKLGYIASLSGIIMAVCSITLYEKFGKTISRKGVIISSIIMIIMVFLAENALITSELIDEIDKVYKVKYEFWDIFKELPDLITSGAIDQGLYIKDLVLLYVFTFIGAFAKIKNSYNGGKNELRNNE